MEGEQLGDLCGTPDYVAPEMVSKNPYGTQIDMWSVGVIFYILLCGYAPFQAEKRSTLFQLIKKGDIIFHSKYWKNVSSNAQNFVKKLLDTNPKTRLTATMALKHPWMLDSKETLAKFSTGPEYQRTFRRFNAKRKIMAVARAVIAMNRMKRYMGSKKAGNSRPATSTTNPLHPKG